MKTSLDYKMKATNIIRMTRADSGKSQEEMAKLMGCCRNTIDNWENGKSYPTLPDVIKWFEVLHLDGSIINSECSADLLHTIESCADNIIQIIQDKRSDEFEE